jgi:hypothetical protein
VALRLGGLCVPVWAIAPAFAGPSAAAGATGKKEQFETHLSASPLTDDNPGKSTTLMPDVHRPNNGAAVFVFALSDN